MITKFSRGLCIFLVCTFVLFIFTNSVIAAGKQPRLEKIVLSSPFVALVLPMAYMAKYNTLKDIAKKTELVIWNNPDQLRAIMVQNQAHFVSVPSNTASIFYNKGMDLKLLSISIWGIFYVISSDPTITSLSDLKGEKIYIPFRGDQPDLLFQFISRRQGLNPFKDLNIQYASSPLDITMSLLAGQIKHGVMHEPAASVAIMKGKQRGINFRRVIDIQKEWANVTNKKPIIPNSGVVALPNILKHPNVVEVFVKAYADAVKWSNENPKEAGQIAAEYIRGVPAAVFSESLKYTTFKCVSAQDAKEPITYLFSKYMKMNPAAIGGKIPDEGFFYK